MSFKTLFLSEIFDCATFVVLVNCLIYVLADVGEECEQSANEHSSLLFSR